jgi:endoglucanase
VRLRRLALAGALALCASACGGLSPGPGPWTKTQAGAGGAAVPTPPPAAGSDARAIDPTPPPVVDAGDIFDSGTGTGGAGDSGPAGPMTVDPDATSDDIYGTDIARSDSYWVARGRLFRGRDEVRLHGINWFGLETQTLALFGPNQGGGSVANMLAQLKSLGFNALRVPLSPESIEVGVPSMAWANRGAIDTGREHFEELIAAASGAGMYLLFDVHTCAAAVGHMKTGPADPRCAGYGIEAWLADLRALAALAEQHAPYVVGIDLFNEPYGLTHEAWRELVGQASRAVLETNPRILVFVEGVGGMGYGGVYSPFWGENLTGVAGAPFDVPPARLVYSPHAYGPSISEQVYFKQDTFPSNMPDIWDEHFGYLFERDQPIVPGEFGGRYAGSDQIWQDAFVDYLIANDAHSFFYWSLNPNSGDTGGLLQDDWRTVNPGKLALLQRLMR